jgi:hypothetical protein
MLKPLAFVEAQRETIRYWFPILAAGLVAGLVFLMLGKTPFVRTLALAGTIGVMALTLRRFGSMLALAGGLALAFSPVFWSQTGGGAPTTFTTIVALVLVVGFVTAAFIWLSKRTGLAMKIGLVL